MSKNFKVIPEARVLPLVSQYIKQLGFDLSEVSIEHKTITLSIFNNVELKIGSKNKRTAYGRIDIMVKNEDGSPLLVVELKKPSIPILQGEKQAVSYARLLLAPLVVITNGIETKLYDPFTPNGDEISDAAASKYFKSGFKINISEELKYEAFSYFISYSKENLQTFCDSQIENKMKFLRGSISDPDKKYISDLYVPHNGLKESFNEFIRNEKKIFIIEGESGSGKTNAICYLAEETSPEYPVLFYSLTKIGSNIREQIEKDFNYNFSAEKNVVSIIKRVDHIIERHGIKLLIFLDAIDEYNVLNASALVGDFFDEVYNFKNIKLCCTVKSTRVNEFLYIKDVPNLALSFDQYVCHRFHDRELDQLIEKYTIFYGLNGKVSGQNREYCRLPFLARIIHEVYAKEKINDTIVLSKLIETYLERKLAKIDSKYKEVALILLNRVVVIMQQRNLTSNPIQEIYSMQLEYLGEALDYLTEHYILVKEDLKLFFYWERIRDYLLAFKVGEWLKLSDYEFQNILGKMSSNVILQNAASLYYDVTTNESHKSIMRKFFEMRVIKFTERYEYYLNTYFKQIKTLFIPGLKNKVGIVIFKQPAVSYAFQAVSDSDSRISWVTETNEDGLPEFGPHRKIWVIHYGFHDFETHDNVDKGVKILILRQLNDLLKKRKLLPGFYLSTIKLLEFIQKYQIQLGYRDLDLTKLNDLFPIEFSEFTATRIGHLLLWIKHANNIFNKLLPTNPTQMHDLNVLSPMLISEYDNIDEMVTNDIKNDISGKVLKNDDFELRNFLDLVNSLRNKISLIERPSFSYLEKRMRIVSNYEDVKDFINKFFTTMLSEYKQMVENNFEPICRAIPLYEFLPVTVVVECDLDNQIPNIVYAIIPNTLGTKVIVVKKGSSSIFNEKNLTVRIKNFDYEIDSYVCMGLNELLLPNIIENWCYGLLTKELEPPIMSLV